MRRRFWRVPIVFLCLACALPACSSASYVPRLAIVNPTSYDLLVDLKGEPEASALELGIAPKGGESVRQHVLDVGDEWIFTFSYLGEEAGSATVKRADLQRAQWKFAIPEEVGAHLQEKGVAPSY